MINALQIIDHFYPVESPLKTLLLKHSMQVRDKALAILDNCQEETRVRIDRETVVIGALLHDIGIRECDAPSIECHGKQNYIAHGTIGAEMLRRYGSEQGMDLEAFARICERHTGSGLTAKEIRQQCLPIPEQDYLPETLEEKLVCLADKFFSKSGSMKEKDIDRVRKSMMKYGTDTIERFDAMCALFNI